MTDRLLVLKDKKKQRYGTQLDGEGRQTGPESIEDAANVDPRRKETGAAAPGRLPEDGQ